ncbi:hypothetical protein NEOLEDRAFT_1158121 [Neolentinus lepideus HHB14362 ss-1]|uniref:Trypsin-like serine protease n=1 Tax=Neolentinus lepideus HHB14362 ss-1 TaxID=1314782 RepID=A0A165PZ84_9AGAM|nr:hypothetical protein NEOLEDRAFT_1158121 [Neolentinus lepideus HHB14362 ss-1]
MFLACAGRSVLRTLRSAAYLRNYATADSPVALGKAPSPPKSNNTRYELDARILNELLRRPSTSRVNLGNLVLEYMERGGNILQTSLPYESRPSSQRKVQLTSAAEDGVAMVAHCVRDGENHKISLSSAFALEGSWKREGESVIVSCAHTMEEIRRSPLLTPDQLKPILDSASNSDCRLSGSFVISGSRETTEFHPVSAVLSALHRSDLVLFRKTGPVLKTLPVSPYPAHPNTAIRAHFVADEEPEEPGWVPWIGGTWSKWVRGTVLGYRDFAGREAKPGTYDALSHLMFQPVPTPGSSGGPIVDEESGAVIGVILGTRQDLGIQGLRGWGVPAEVIFEMFSLPGLSIKQ